MTLLLILTDFNKKVSYRKHNARQRRVTKISGQGNFISSSSLITVEIMFAVSRTVCANTGGPKKIGNAEVLFLRMGARLTPCVTLPNLVAVSQTVLA